MAITDGLKMVYEMEDDQATTTIQDAHTTNNDGSSVNNANTYYTTSGKISGALHFNGSSDRIDMPALFTDNQSGSVCFWAKCDTTSAEQRAFTYNDEGVFLFFRLNDGGTSGAVEVGIRSGTDKSITSGSVSITDWNHYAATWLENDYIRVYLNGAEVGAKAITTVAEIASAGRRIGTSRDGGGAHMDGPIDQVAVWHRVLSQSEIDQVYNSGSGLEYPWTPADPNVTVTPSALSLSLTDKEPTVIVTVGVNGMSANLNTNSVRTKRNFNLGTVNVGTAKLGEKEIRTKWPFTVGLEAGTNKHSNNPQL